MLPRKPISTNDMSQEEYQKKAEQFLSGDLISDNLKSKQEVKSAAVAENGKKEKTKNSVNCNFLVPKQLHKQTKATAARLDMTLTEYMLLAIQNENIKNS